MSLVEKFNIRSLANNQDKYIIPIYQRNYAWGIDEVELLISDLKEAYEKNKNSNYYVGSLIVYKRNDYTFEVIDGQQRLTTFKILLKVIDEELFNSLDLSFDCRIHSTEALNHLGSSIKNNSENSHIIHNYEFMKSNIDKDTDFLNFIKEKVIIIRTEIPKGTDLNHYFEIMNNRGEQLEQHEIIKADLMEKLSNESERSAFAAIWDACSDMDAYLIKKFSYSSDNENSVRTKLFGDLCNHIPTNFDSIKDIFRKEGGGSEKNTILTLLKRNLRDNNQEDRNADENRDATFKSIIDFPNFLMISLRIFFDNDEISLNDKYLIKTFKDYFKESDKSKVAKFIIFLLKIRVLFDRYIIKSKEDDDWVLYALKKYKRNNKGKDYFYFGEVNSFGKAILDDIATITEEVDNNVETDKYKEEHKKIIMLLSMFHVSFRQKIYKEWLYEVLKFLSNKVNIDVNLRSDEYINFLEKLANEFFYDRKELLDCGTGTPNYIFNYLDYLLWRDLSLYYNTDNIHYPSKLNSNKIILSKAGFSFSMARNSVEHYYPRSRQDNDNVENNIDSFGNLCLISHYQNSSLNAKSTEEKRAQYLSGDIACASLKQAIMLSKSTWDTEAINKHGNDMKRILEKETERVNYLEKTNE